MSFVTNDMSYINKLTAAEKIDLEFQLNQERNSAAVEGFQLDEEAFRQAWAKVVVSHRISRERKPVASTRSNKKASKAITEIATHEQENSLPTHADAVMA